MTDEHVPITGGCCSNATYRYGSDGKGGAFRDVATEHSE